MLNRFYLSAFWNFYDSLGIFTLLSLAMGVLFVCLLPIAALAVGNIVNLAIVLIAICLGTLCFSISAEYVLHTVDEQPSNLKKCLCKGFSAFRRYALHASVVVLGNLLLCGNLYFYSSWSRVAQDSHSLQLAILSLAIVVVLMFCLFNLVAFIVSGLLIYQRETNYKKILSNSLKLFVVWPFYWFFIMSTYLGLVIIAVATIVGIFYLPTLLAIFTYESARIASKQFGYIIQVKQSLTDHTARISTIKHDAEQLAIEEYYRKEKRSFREIIKPWE